MRPDVAHALVRDELFLDSNAQKNLATLRQTWLSTAIDDLMDLSNIRRRPRSRAAFRPGSRQIPLEKGRLGMPPEDVIQRCDENTIGVMPAFGVTFTRHDEPVAAIAAALGRLQAETGLDIPIHVDAAFRRAWSGVGFSHPAREIDQRVRL